MDKALAARVRKVQRAKVKIFEAMQDISDGARDKLFEMGLDPEVWDHTLAWCGSPMSDEEKEWLQFVLEAERLAASEPQADEAQAQHTKPGRLWDRRRRGAE